jgi:hypothetical protein
VLVPNQAWGWAPAHLGTWFWSKTNGWIWIPGDAFSPGICSTGLVNYPWDWLWATMNPYFSDPIFPNIILQDLYWNWYSFTPNYWITKVFGNTDLYRIYRQRGAKTWRKAYVRTFKLKPPHRKPALKNLPENIRDIIGRINRLPVTRVETYLSQNRPEHSIRSNMSLMKKLDNRIQESKLPASVLLKLKQYKSQSGIRKDEVPISRIDWNPDSQWARKTGLKIFYSSRKNAIKCPELKLYSSQINQARRSQLKRSVISGGNRINGEPICAGSCVIASQQSTGGNQTAKTSGSASNSNSSKNQ